MNPSSRKNPLDSAKYREQYLSNLRLQASNDQRNQNANLIFKNTGQTPSRPPDMRTTTERASDIEGLKVDLRSKLNQITDGVIAQQIIGELEPDQIRFAINNWNTIEPDMKKQFASGVPTSAFIAYLNRLISKFQLTDGVETGLQQSSGNSIIMSNTQIIYGLPKPQIWNILKGVLDLAKRQFGVDIEAISYAIQQNEYILPNLEESNYIQQLPMELKAEIQRIANSMYNNVASNKELTDIIAELNIGLANRDKRYTEKVLDKAVSTITLDESVVDQKEEILDLIRQYLKQGVQSDSNLIEGGDNNFPKVEVEEKPDIEDLSWEEILPAQKPELVRSASNMPAPTASTYKSFSSKEAFDKIPATYTQDEWDRLERRTKTDFLRKRLVNNPDMILHTTNGKEYGENAYVTIKGAQTRKGGKTSRLPWTGDLTNAQLDNMFDEWKSISNDGTIGEGLKGKMSGCGFAVKEQKVVKQRLNKPYRQSITHLVDKPVEKPKPYTQFGRYYINKHRLEGEGIMAFRLPSGNTVPTLPTEKISKNLSKVVRTLVGKGIPSYEDIAELTQEEKNKLHHICKTCRVDSPAVPKMKGEGQQEEDRFNILRGEIIAGNDNVKIAKEFKVILLKFMNEGRIPKRQANEILQELLALGH